MGHRALKVADIFRDHGSAWREANRGHLSLGQLKVMSAIERCRTAALGGHVMRCENEACAYTAIAYNSCRNRHCPKCQGAAARHWMAARAAELLPVPYFHVVFTLPAPTGDIAYQNKAVIYDLLFRASAETMVTIAADPKHLGANRRLVAADAKTVTFRVKDYRVNGPGRYKTMTLDAHEFIRRFLIHVLPKGFHRIRHYGLLASGVKADNLALARKLLDLAPPAPEPEDTACERPTALKPCPCCGSAMRVIEVFEAGEPARHRSTTLPAARIDTS